MTTRAFKTIPAKYNIFQSSNIMLHLHSLLILLAIIIASTTTEAFQRILPCSNRISRVTPRLFDSKEDEIAKLEDQLRKLKEEKEREQASVIAVLDETEQLEEVPLEMFLTEQWKQQEADAEEGLSSGGGLTNILYAVGAALLIALFSQVPIGQEDLSKYSVGTSPPVEQIDLGDLNRARRSGDL